MKRLFTILFYAIVIVIFALLFFIYLQNQKKTAIAEKIQSLPDFTFRTLGNSDFSKTDIIPEIPLIISYFHPECEHCQYDAKDIVKHKSDFNNCQILMISTSKTEEIKQFAEKYNLNELENLVLLHDTAFVFEDTFGKSPLPTLLIYSKEHKLLEKFSGEVKAEKIIEILNQ